MQFTPITADMFDASTALDAAKRWRGMDELVRDIRNFHPGKRLSDDEKRLLLSMIERLDYLMPPSVHKMRKYQYDVSVTALSAPNADQQARASHFERWQHITQDMCAVLAPAPPTYHDSLQKIQRKDRDVRAMQATSGAITHLVKACEPHLGTIEKDFPDFYKALIPLRYSTQLMEIRKAAIAHESGEMNTQTYASIIDEFLSDSHHRQHSAHTELEQKIANSKTQQIIRKTLPQTLLIEAMQIQLPSTQNHYSLYTKTLTNALSKDIQCAYPALQTAETRPPQTHGESHKMVLEHPNAPWLEYVYAYRWVRVMQEVMRQTEAHKTEFWGCPPAQALEAKWAERTAPKTGQQELPGF